jgi:hypothetical protein
VLHICPRLIPQIYLFQLCKGLDPAFHSGGDSNAVFISKIICCEYGSIIMGVISNGNAVSDRKNSKFQRQNEVRKKKDKDNRREGRFKSLKVKQDLEARTDIEWPTLVDQDPKVHVTIL